MINAASPSGLDFERTAAIAKALAHPARVQIVELLASQPQCRGADVFAELPLAQSTVSEHLKVLRDAGIVSASPAGNSTTYCLRQGVLDRFAGDIAALAGLIATDGCPVDSGEGACS